MCFLVQAALFGGASLITWLVCGVAHAPLWAGCVGAGVFFFAAWVTYLYYQATHPDFWCPWDDGLPQVTRMGNAFIPAIGVFCVALILIPTFQQAREKARAQQEQRRQKIEASKERGTITPHARPR